MISSSADTELENPLLVEKDHKTVCMFSSRVAASNSEKITVNCQLDQSRWCGLFLILAATIQARMSPQELRIHNVMCLHLVSLQRIHHPCKQRTNFWNRLHQLLLTPRMVLAHQPNLLTMSLRDLLLVIKLLGVTRKMPVLWHLIPHQ